MSAILPVVIIIKVQIIALSEALFIALLVLERDTKNWAIKCNGGEGRLVGFCHIEECVNIVQKEKLGRMLGAVV